MILDTNLYAMKNMTVYLSKDKKCATATMTVTHAAVGLVQGLNMRGL
jgi:hypothetical protein